MNMIPYRYDYEADTLSPYDFSYLVKLEDGELIRLTKCRTRLWQMGCEIGHYALLHGNMPDDPHHLYLVVNKGVVMTRNLYTVYLEMASTPTTDKGTMRLGVVAYSPALAVAKAVSETLERFWAEEDCVDFLHVPMFHVISVTEEQTVVDGY